MLSSAILLRQVANSSEVLATYIEADSLAKMQAIVQRDGLCWAPTDTQRVACLILLAAIEHPNRLYTTKEATPADVWHIAQQLPPEVLSRIRVKGKGGRPTQVGFRKEP